MNLMNVAGAKVLQNGNISVTKIHKFVAIKTNPNLKIS